MLPLRNNISTVSQIFRLAVSGFLREFTLFVNLKKIALQQQADAWSSYGELAMIVGRQSKMMGKSRPNELSFPFCDSTKI